MIADPLSAFSQIWLTDFEFCAPPGELPSVLCAVFRELRSGETRRYWRNGLVGRNVAPIPVGPDILMVAYYLSAEISCFLALGWPVPERGLDLFAEFRNLSNGLEVPCGNSLLGALAWHGIDCIDATEKESMRSLAMRGDPYSYAEQIALLDYCQTDVDALSKLLPVMLPHIDLPRALFRARYMVAAARMERDGIPVDVEMLDRLRSGWPRIKSKLIEEVDRGYNVYEGCSFREKKFANYLIENGIPWPQLASGRLDLKDDTFKEMAKSYPQISPLRELRHSLSEMRLESLAVGGDWRNRCLLSAFNSKTGRNQPSNTQFIFGPATWLRGLIKPPRGSALAYIDWSQQEFGIAAALSGDAAMMEAYTSDDPYLTFAKQAGAAPAGATKATHGEVRERFKTCALGVLYGMGQKRLAERLNVSESLARELLQLHRQTYPVFWGWSQSAVDFAMLHGWLQTVFGWRINVSLKTTPQSLSNFPMQANGAEMLRLACCLATERGICVACPVHDALLVEGPTESIEDVVHETQAAMAEASRVVLSGFELRSEAKIVRYPDRYSDPRGLRFWNITQSLLGDETCCTHAHHDDEVVAPMHTPLLHGCTPTCSAHTHPYNLLSSSSSYSSS